MAEEKKPAYAQIPVLSKVNIGGKIYYLKDADARSVIDTIYGDYLKSADKAALQSEIDKKVAQTDYDTKVAALEAEDIRIAGLVAAEQKRAEGVEKTLGNRLDAVEGDINAGTKIADGEKLIQRNEKKELFTDLCVDIKKETEGTFIVIYGDKGKTREISKVNANAFVKDGLLESATYNANTHILTLTFNTDAGKSAIDVDLGTLVDTYTAGDGLYFSDEGNHNFAIKIATGSEKFLTVDANGLKISGIEAAISTAVGNAKTELEGKISAEESRATAAENALDGRLDVIEGEGEGSIKAAVAAEQTRATTEEGKLSGRITSLESATHTHANKTVLDGITSDKVSNWDNEVGAKAAIAAEAETRAQKDAETLRDAKSHAEGLVNKLISENNGVHTHTVSASGTVTPNLTDTTKYLTASAAGVDLTVTDSDTFVKAVGTSKQGLAVAEYVNSVAAVAQNFNDITISVGGEGADPECLTFVQTSKSFNSLGSVGKANAATGKLSTDSGLAQVMTNVSVTDTGTAVGSVVVKSQPTITLSVANSSTSGSIKYVEEVVGAETAVTVSGTAAEAGSHNHGIKVDTSAK